jgi:hypothetical protein
MTIFEIYYSAMERAFGDYPSTSKSTRNPLSPRLERGFSLLSAYQKATTKIVVANFILPLISQTLGGAFRIPLSIRPHLRKPSPSFGSGPWPHGWSIRARRRLPGTAWRVYHSQLVAKEQ